MDNSFEKIIQLLSQNFPDPKMLSSNLKISDNLSFGDLILNYFLKLGPDAKKKADEYVFKLQQNAKFKKYFKKVEVVGGYVNFWFSDDVLINNLIYISKQKEKYSKSNLFKSKKIMFEFAHPNTHKAFHIGHLRNITTGESLSRIFAANGAKVIRTNYQGDVGLHIAKAIYGIQINGFHDPKDIQKRAEYLGKVYAIGATKFEESEKEKEIVATINKKIYDKSDEEINKLYQTTRKWSLEYFELIYKRVYTKFDRLYFESEVVQSGKEIALKALESNIFVKSDGAVIFEGKKHGLHDRVFISGAGIPTYEAKDLGLAKLQFEEFNPDLVIHAVSTEQTEYFKVVIKALEFVQPQTKGREVHIPYGWVKLKQGKMSSRTGNVILGEAILDQAKESILKSYPNVDSKTAEIIAVGAVKYSFLKVGLTQEIAFDLKESISLEGNSGPYLQYTFARTQSILNKSKLKSKKIVLKKGDLNLNSEEKYLLSRLNQYQNTLILAANNYSPNLICNYLYDLASSYNSFYQKNKIIGSENEEVRILITLSVNTLLKLGLNLLGIETPEKM